MEKFSYEANGYNRNEVNRFVSDVIRETEGIITRVRKQNTEIEELKKELQHYREIEANLKNAIVQAKADNESDNIKKMAREERDMIVRDAKSNASRIVNEALLRAEKIELKADTLERNMRIFKKKLKSILEQQQAIVDEIEILELEDK
ncbi:MAG: DivIVA domain-containing protein [Bacilli bacterium]|nr:DivIVA domain-containing protein [Bacilli bacterium]